MSNINVVIADDNERIRQNLQEIVSRECDMTLVGSASDGMDALSMIRTSHPDVVLLDIIMPKMDGLGVLEEVKKDENLLKKPAFIILTAMGQEEVMEEALGLGANYVLLKPFDSNALVKKIRQIKNGKIAANRKDFITLKEKTEEALNTFPMKPVWTTEEIIEGLPYELTNAQKNVWHEIERDLSGHKLMSRLVQGDVGSGKTVIAFLAMILSAENGFQSALMVPTEVLANQHYEGFLNLMEEQKITSCRPVLLTGSTTAKQKREIYQKIADGEVNIIIGTHALIQEKVEYKNLGLVITDEQHRFGVRQREALTTRGNPPHVLVMSATPIPRTLAIILYGDLDISIIDELPAKRLPIKNCVVGTAYRPKAYSFIEKQVHAGRQAYVICPMVEESEGLDAENVTDYAEKLREALPEDIRIEILHGKMKPKEKNKIMESFASGEIQILVSTTVVEVGVNVPNATVMMVENAERFGLAQLHQLRGRVGRGEHQSYCIFIQGNNEEDTSKRLKILNESNDGFFIAGEDLKLRGPGDLFGIRQSGLMEFKIGDIYNDAGILKDASETAGEILALDFDLCLPQHELLKARLLDYMSEDLENLGI